MDLALTRDPGADLDPVKSYGVLRLSAADGSLLLEIQTIELPWHPATDGSPGGTCGLSCVPPGVYQLVPHSSLKHPRTFALHSPELGVYAEPNDVPSSLAYMPRTDCLIHPDNVTATLEGCIGPGLTRGELGGLPAVLESQEAFARLSALLPWEAGHTLVISGG